MRVLQWRAEQLLGRTMRRCRPFGGPLTFNGGPSNCSAGHRTSSPSPVACATFNGGPSNCSAGRGRHHVCRPPPPYTFNGGPSNCSAGHAHDVAGGAELMLPSMEGRAIARPDGRTRRGHHRPVPRPSMEGRAIARPDAGCGKRMWRTDSLQWRAEQLLGRTARLIWGG